MIKNDLLLRSIRGDRVDRYPVWLMRQAGRYMKEYRELRAKERDFTSFCKNVELATEVSLLPLKLLGVDAIIIFSDILVPLEALGVGVEFVEGEGPKLGWDKNLGTLKRYKPEANAYVYEIIKRVKNIQQEVPVIGFAGAPFTLASYMIEGGSSRDFRRTKLFMWEREKDFRSLMELLVDTLVKYISAQIEAGADVIQIFDSWTNYLSYQDYEIHIVEHVKALIGELKGRYDTPIIYFFKGSSSFLKLAEETESDVLSIDWSVRLGDVSQKSPKALQGNLDPMVLYGSDETIRSKTLTLLKDVGRESRYIFNLGHGLAPDMEFRKVKLLVDTVKGFNI